MISTLTRRRDRGLTRFTTSLCVLACASAWAQPASSDAGKIGVPGSGNLAVADQEATREDFSFARRLSRVFKTVATNVEPAVVHVTKFNTVQPRDFFGRPIGRASLRQTGLGSGAIVDASGVVLTNNHVIDGGEQLRVKLSNGEEFPARLLGRDANTDLAVLRIENPPNELPSLRFTDSDAIDVGEWVVAVGSPFGLDNSVTQGIISARGRSVTPRETGRSYEDYIQTDAAINPGNSGGPLVNLEGEIVGINTAIASRTGGYDGIGFAIPSNTARIVLEAIVKNGRVQRGWLGVGLAPADEENGQPRVRVDSVMMGSPAEQAGLKEGDLITRFQGVAMDEARLRNAIATLPAGSQVGIEILRDGVPTRLTATLGDRSAATNSTYVDQLGIEVTALDERARKALGFGGVLITEVQDGTLASEHGLQRNDIIVAIGEDDVTDADSLRAALDSANLRRGVRVNVIRGNERGYIILRSQ